MELWEVVAREAIRDLVTRYNANGDSGRFAQVYELFAPDAAMEISAGIKGSGVYRGHDQISQIFTGTRDTLIDGAGAEAAAAAQAPAGSTYMRHYTATHQIDLVDQTHAKGRCYYQVLMPHGLDHWGRCLDEYECRDGRWLFTYRKVTQDGWVPGGMGAAAVEA